MFFTGTECHSDMGGGNKTYSPITLAIAVCLYICVTRPMTSVKGLSVATTPDPIPFISLSHSAKLAEASCKSRRSQRRWSCVLYFFIYLALSLACSLLFWDIKGKTINGAAGCPTFCGRERNKEGEKLFFLKDDSGGERWRIPKDATPSDWAAVLGGSWEPPNYSCLVTSWGRRWRRSRAGTINQRRLAWSQGDWRGVFKAAVESGEDRSGRGCRWRPAYAALCS